MPFKCLRVENCSIQGLIKEEIQNGRRDPIAAWAGHISEPLVNRMLLSMGFVFPGLFFEVYLLKHGGSELQCLLTAM